MNNPFEQFKATYFAEAAELLETWERELLALEGSAHRQETLDTLFRAVHSIKGAAASFGFDAVTDLGHATETLLDALRSGSLPPTPAVVDALFQARDTMQQLLAAAKADHPHDAAALTRMLSLLTSDFCSVAALHDAASQHESPVREAPASPAANDSSIRISLETIDHLMSMAGDLITAQAKLGTRLTRCDTPPEVMEEVGTLSSRTRALWIAVMGLRMQPAERIFPRLQRVARETAQQLGKSVELRLEGGTTELDQTVLEKLVDPLTHMIRNAIDHGIESPAQRAAQGKPAHGTLTLHIENGPGEVHITLSDDGAGMDRERLRVKAQSLGLTSAATAHSPEALDRIIFAPGFSTANQITAISGRGVGMDVVHRNIEALGGDIAIQNRPGEGLSIALTLPQSLALASLNGASPASLSLRA